MSLRGSKKSVIPVEKLFFAQPIKNQPLTANGLPVFFESALLYLIENGTYGLHFRRQIERSSGTKSEGIFRVNANTNTVQKLRGEWETGERTSFTKEDDCNTVAALLKLYLRELPVALMEYELYGNVT